MNFDEKLRWVLGGLQSIENNRNREFLRELVELLVELAEEHESATHRAASLSRRVEELEQKLELATNLRRENGAYWRPGSPEPGPYCVRCWDEDRRLMHQVPRGEAGKMICPRCST